MESRRVLGTPVLVFEPHALYRVALSRMIQGSRGRLALVAETADHPEAVRVASTGAAQVIVFCLEGVLQAPDIRALAGHASVVVVSEASDGETVLAAMRAGASAFLPKSASAVDIADAIERVSLGEVVVHPSAATAALMLAAGRLGPPPADIGDDVLEVLSGREREVIELMASGSRPSTIANDLCLSRRTVEGHLLSAYRKLGVRGSVEAVQTVLRGRPNAGRRSA